MFSRKRQPELLDEVVVNAVSVLMTHDKGTEDYAKQLESVIRLLELRVERDTKNSISKDTLTTVGANLLGLLMIIKHESVHVISQKALSFLIKPKI